MLRTLSNTARIGGGDGQEDRDRRDVATAGVTTQREHVRAVLLVAVHAVARVGGGVLPFLVDVDVDVVVVEGTVVDVVVAGTVVVLCSPDDPGIVVPGADV